MHISFAEEHDSSDDSKKKAAASSVRQNDRNLGRSGTEILQRFDQAIEPGQAVNMHDRTAAALHTGKDMGLAGPGMIAHSTARPGLNPYAVSELPLSIQKGFRRKMLSLLVIQLLFTVGLAAFLRFVPACRRFLEIAFPAQSLQALLLLLATMVTLPLLSMVKNKHPVNLIAVFLWSILCAFFIAASDLDGAFFRSHGFFVIMIELTGCVALLAVFSQIQLGSGQSARLLSFTVSGLVSYSLIIVCAACAYAYMRDDQLSSIEIGPFVVTTITAAILFAWIVYDSYKLCCKMSPDEYLKGVICFYTDMFYMFICCCLVACLGSSGSR